MLNNESQVIDHPTPGHNVDESEIAKFQAMASIWWDPCGDFKALHAINDLRLGYLNARCPLKGLKILDVGCGGGILSEAMAALGAQVTGIDAGYAPWRLPNAILRYPAWPWSINWQLPRSSPQVQRDDLIWWCAWSSWSMCRGLLPW